MRKRTPGRKSQPKKGTRFSRRISFRDRLKCLAVSEKYRQAYALLEETRSQGKRKDVSIQAGAGGPMSIRLTPASRSFCAAWGIPYPWPPDRIEELISGEDRCCLVSPLMPFLNRDKNEVCWRHGLSIGMTPDCKTAFLVDLAAPSSATEKQFAIALRKIKGDLKMNDPRRSKPSQQDIWEPYRLSAQGKSVQKITRKPLNRAPSPSELRAMQGRIAKARTMLRAVEEQAEQTLKNPG